MPFSEPGFPQLGSWLQGNGIISPQKHLSLQNEGGLPTVRQDTSAAAIVDEGLYRVQRIESGLRVLGFGV